MPLPSSLVRKLDAAQRLPQSEGKIAYQIVAVQLRVWLADQNDVACRPWYIFCLELYPRGKVINQRLHSPASRKPSSEALLDFLLDHIVEPPDGEARARPTHVSFVAKEETAMLKPLLSKLKIEVGTLTLADGIDDYIKLFSNKLVEREQATRAEASERPGLLSVKGVTADMISDLMSATVEMFNAEPWKRIPEHIALEIRLPSSDDSKYRDRYYVTVLGSDEKVQGFALMASLKTLREKYRRAILRLTDDTHDSSDEDENSEKEAGDTNGNGVESNKHSFAVSKTMDDIFLCAACGKRVGEIAAQDGAKYVDRCGGCKRLLYCGERCQKLDWRARHKGECRQATTDADFVFKRDEWAWLQREIALLFLDPTAIPFDDLEANEKHNWKFVDNVSPPLYPMPFVTVQGSTIMTNRMDRPTAKEVKFATLIAKALTECVSPPPADGVLHLASGVSIACAENLAESIHFP